MKGYVDAKRNNERRDGYDWQLGEWPLGASSVNQLRNSVGKTFCRSRISLLNEFYVYRSGRARILESRAIMHPRCMLGRAGTIIFRECPRIVLSARLTIRLTSNCLDIFCWIMSYDYHCCSCSNDESGVNFYPRNYLKLK